MELTFTQLKALFWQPPRTWLQLIVAFLLPIVAQSQSTKTELTEKMQSLFETANQLYDNLPQRDFNSNYITLAFGISPHGQITGWHTVNICDCEGNVVDVKNVSQPKVPLAWSLGWERRFLKAYSIRLAGSYAHLSHGQGRRIVAENGSFTQMKQAYRLSQLGLQGSILGHFRDFYGGVGFFQSLSQASGFDTELKKSDLNSVNTTFYKLKADVVTAKQADFAPQLFVGYRRLVSSKTLMSLELGISRKIYTNIQLNFPLSARSRSSFDSWLMAYRHYQTIRQQAVAIDRQLHPNKYESSSDGGGGSSGGGCSN
ncbi:MAG: hypothetical protein JNL70_25365 [Saprospiraceae bacterium]|nr:hypothetical protein [Saprospiraceae bacterium]